MIHVEPLSLTIHPHLVGPADLTVNAVHVILIALDRTGLVAVRSVRIEMRVLLLRWWSLLLRRVLVVGRCLLWRSIRGQVEVLVAVFKLGKIPRHLDRCGPSRSAVWKAALGSHRAAK